MTRGPSIPPWFNQPQMNGWLGELLFFAQLFLHWATSSLRRTSATSSRIMRLSGLLVLRAASQLAPVYLLQFFSSCSCYTAFGGLQLQPRLAQEHHYGPKLFIHSFTLRLARCSCNLANRELGSTKRAVLGYTPVSFRGFFMKLTSFYSLVRVLHQSA